MSKDIAQATIRMGSSTSTEETVSVTTQIVRTSTKQPNTYSVTLEIS
jgi:hypothetical protein